ncbi:transmembrane channel-like protein 7 [Hypomesus transpacificus]|uniref:transmembrane channel-like protein 7 n=1 Tax=Hypomesus transpacificus TaxID=137520 RepID=UPI001F077826|nr:transmembrane channel-like protein 7 [Hypomesus transpacificus]
MELKRQVSTVAGNGYPGAQQSLRLRRALSSASNQNGPQFNWGSHPEEGEEGGESESHQDLRALPLPLALKRAVREVQQMRVPVVTSWESWKRSKGRSLNRLRENASGGLAYIALWRKALQKIGGNFGGGVQSYFLFLRFLVILNFFSFLLIGGFVLVPSIVFRTIGNSTFNNTGPKECLIYDPNPQGLLVFYNYFLDLLSGTGFMEYSYLFYGFYDNTVAESSGFTYNIPLAYILTAVFYFAFCFICIIVRMGSAARVAVATVGGAAGSYSKLVFTGWDYGCQGDRATRLKQNNIRYQFQVDLEEERRLKKAASLTLGQTVWLYTLRTVLSLICLGLIGAAFTAIAEATTFSQSQTGVSGIQGLLWEYLPSIVMTAGNFLVPFLCDQIALLERYSPSTTVIVALLRSVFLRLVSLGVLLFTLWNQITCYQQKELCQLCHYNYKEYPCWETRVGQEMYKLAIFDFLTTIAVLVLVEFPRRMVVDQCSCKLTQWVGRQEFLVPTNVLGLVYGQTVVWTGALFCPLLPLINTLKFVILFYCKKITLFQNCRPAVKTFRSTTSTFFFLVVLLFGWSLALVAMIYSLAKIHPSWSCGPFRSLSTMWIIIPNTFDTLSLTTRDFLYYIGSQAFSIPFFIFFCVALCYVAALASVYGKSVALLRAQLKLEGRDKQFLVKQIEELSLKMGVQRGRTDDYGVDATWNKN